MPCRPRSCRAPNSICGWSWTIANVRQRVALNNTLQWHLHDLWPELQLPGSSLFYGNWGPRVAGPLARTEQTMRVRIARDELRRIRELTQTIKALEAEIAGLVAQIAPQLLSEPGFGPLTAAKLLGEIADSAETALLAELRSLRRELAELRTELLAFARRSKDPSQTRPTDTAG
jgi:transposase